MSPRTLRWLKLAAKLIGPLLLVLIWRGNSEAFRAALSAWSPRLTLLAALLYLPYALLRVVRWRLLLRIQGIEYGFWTTLRIYYATAFLGMITPGRIGELSRLGYLQRDHGAPHSKTLAGTVVDRLHDLAMLLLLCSILLFVPQLRLAAGLILFAASLVALILLLPFIGRGVIGVVPLSADRRSGLRDSLERYHSHLQGFAHRAHVAPALATVGGTLIYGAMMALLQHAVGVEISWVVAGGVGALGALVSLLPISFLGIGTRDATIAAAYIGLGVMHPAASAIAYSALYLLFFSGISSCIGFIAYQMDPLHTYYLRSPKEPR